MVLPVLFGDVLQHLVAAVHAEVHVDVRHADALGVQEPLEQQVVGNGVKVRYSETVSHEAACGGAAARAHGDALFLGIADEVPDDQKIAGKAHLAEHLDLEFQPFLIRLSVDTAGAAHSFDLREPLFKPCAAEFGHVGFARRAFGHGEVGEVVLAEFEFQVAALGNGDGVRDRLGHMGKGLLHLLRRLHVKRLRGELHPVRVLHGFAGLDAEEGIVGLVVLHVQIMAVVGGHHRDAGVIRQPDQFAVGLLLLRDAVVLEFKIKVVASEEMSR